MSDEPEPRVERRKTPPEGEDPAVYLGRQVGNLTRSIQAQYATRRDLNIRTVVGLLFCALLAWLAISNRILFDEVRQTNTQIVECTTPTPPGADVHECYEESQATLARAIGQLNDAADERTDRILEQMRAMSTTTTTSPVLPSG